MPIRALALETTSRRAEVALVEDGAAVATDSFSAGLKHTADLLPMIDRLCRSRKWSPRDIEHIYVSAGPGGFTGTRTGIAFAKTFAFARGAKVVAVPTPLVLVENAPPEAPDALVVIDARRGKAWVQQFRRVEGAWTIAAEPRLDGLAEILNLVPRPIWLVGEGVAYHAAAIDATDAQIHMVADHAPQVGHLARIGWSFAQHGRFTDPFDLVPIYMRRPEAEEKRLGID